MRSGSTFAARFTAIALIILLLIACGHGRRATFAPNPDVYPAAAPGVDESFRLEMLGSNSSAPMNLVIVGGNGGVLVRVVAEESTAFRGLFFNLHYDASRYTPLAAQATEEWVSPADSIVLEIMNEPGVVAFGQAPIGGGAASGVAEQSVLAEVLFAEEAFTGGTRSASAVPIHPSALAPLSWDAETGELSWYYVNTGDYDQNGVVGISDITPLAIHFMEAGQFPFASAESVVDGDDDGEITISDLSVIAWYFGNCVEGYNLYYSESFDDVPCSYEEPSVLDPETCVPLDSAIGDPMVDRLRFVYLVGDPQAMGFYWVRPVAEDVEGIRSNLNGGNQSQPPPPGPGDPPDPRYNFVPVAMLRYTYEDASVPLTVTFDASESYDLDGEVLFYDWDFEGDGIYDAWGSDPVITHVYRQVGSYAPLVQVTDNRGATGVFQSPSFDAPEPANIPPTADIVATSPKGEVPLTTAFLASGSRDIDGYIARYEWDLDGDGAYEYDSGGDPSVIYKYSDPGTYIVSVRVTDNRGDTDTDSVEITALQNQPPTADLRATPTSGNAPLAVDFDASGSDDGDGMIVRYWWDFDGDGAYEEATITPANTHTFTGAGIFDVGLMVEDDGGATGTDTVAVTVNVVGNELPVADLQASPLAGDTPLTVDFDASLSDDPDGTVVRYDYDFDNDGIWDAYDSADTVSWTYTSAGSYDAKLRVTDDVGAQDTDVAAIAVNVPGNNPPVAGVGAVPASGDIPLTVDFDASGSYDTDGTIVRYDWDLDGDGNYELYDGSDTPSWTYNFAGSYDAYVKVTDDDGAQDTDLVTIAVNVPGNNPPVADVIADPTFGAYPLTVDFDATGSSDSDGTIVRYDWDFDGDGNFEIYDGNDSPVWNYTTAGAYSAAVKATDDDGAQDTDSVGVVVTGEWEIITVHSAGDKGRQPSLAVIQGRPAISYANTDAVDLMYVRAADTLGLTWNPPVTVDTTQYGHDSSLVAVEGNPAISYGISELKYVRATSSTGSSWGTPVVIDGAVVDGTAMAVVNGRPAIFYRIGAVVPPPGDWDIHYNYVRANDATGSSWGTPITIASFTEMFPIFDGAVVSLAVVDGNPAVAFSHTGGSPGRLVYCRANDANGDTWASPITIETGVHNSFASMAIGDGRPAIFYEDIYPYYVRADDADGDAWGTPLMLGSGGLDSPDSGRMALVGGRPVVAYQEHYSMHLRLYRALNETGTVWGPCETIDDVDSYSWCSVADVAGLPGVAYYDAGSDDLKYAICH